MIKKNVEKWFTDLEPMYLLHLTLIVLVPPRYIVDVVQVIVVQVLTIQSWMCESANLLVCIHRFVSDVVALPVEVGLNGEVPVIC